MGMKSVLSKISAVSVISLGIVAAPIASAQSLPVACPGYKPPSTKIPNAKVGKKVQAAYEAYSADMIDEAIVILKDITAKDDYDRAFVDRFLGNLLAAQEGQANNALDYLLRSVKVKQLNDGDHAATLRLVADLNMQQRQFKQAIDWYQQWMDFTCKEDPDVYTRIAQGFYETQQLPKMIEPADKAIALYEKPNKNPYVMKLTSYYERKMYKETIDIAETLVQLFPENKQWWTQLGFFYMLEENYEKALRTFELAYTQGFLDKASQIKTFAQLYGTLEIPHKSAKIYEKYIGTGLLEKNVDNYSRTANAYHRSKQYLKAAEYYGKAGDLSGDAEHFRKQGTLLLTAERYPQAIAALQKALDKGSKKEGAIHMSLMESYFYQAKFKEAYVHVKKAIADKETSRNAKAWEPYIKEKAKNRGIKI